jgi:phosphate:Na+ symporter
VALALIFIGLLDSLATLLAKIFPARASAANPNAPRHLDPGAFDTPSLALTDAARETLHMGDFVEVMLRKVIQAMMSNDRALIAEVSRMDNIVDKLAEVAAAEQHFERLREARAETRNDLHPSRRAA